ncbi:lytic murein transglycosylase [Atlantibacter sp.]|uniref:lytic murein transglycosylase n=1 Tax=Atlantibacter sp. TaxID=1903473 RepID=UPI002896C55C|nr:lytic murein transglycosylase [Atlantibacter sp.]
MNYAVCTSTFCSCLFAGYLMAAPPSPPPAEPVLPVPASPAAAAQQAPVSTAPDGFAPFVEKLKREARQQGVSEKTINQAFANMHFVEHVVKSDQNQPEKKVLLDAYLNHVITPEKIDEARTEMQNNRQILSRIEQRYGVQPQYLVALWALESRFGKLQGDEDIFSALASLAFEGRREAFFTKELIAALKMVDEGHIEASQMKGSWAGAMGQNQFMPSSYLRYGADGDGDGKMDIWNNIDDVFASSANYLASEGWKRKSGWGQEINLPANFDTALAGTKKAQRKTVAQWQAIGVSFPANTSQPAQQSTAWIVIPDDGEKRGFMVFQNFRTLMTWNRSYYFAISIGMMADAIAGNNPSAPAQPQSLKQ